MKLKGGRKGFYDVESPSKRVRWNSQQKEHPHHENILSQSIQLTSDINQTMKQKQQQQQQQQQQLEQEKGGDMNKELLNNKKQLMSLLVDNNIEFSQLNANQYSATIKLININKGGEKQQNQTSLCKVSSTQGYYAEKDKQQASLTQLNKQNKQPFISAVLNDIKTKEFTDNNMNNNIFNIQLACDPSIDQNDRFLHFLEEKQASVQRELNNAEQLLTIHNTNQKIQQLRDSHQSIINDHKKLVSIYLRSPKQFRIKAIAYLKPIQSTIAQGNYANLRKDSDLEILYSLLQKLLLDNCDAQTMEEFVDEQIKLQACELYLSTTSAASNQAENLNKSYSCLKNTSTKLGSSNNFDEKSLNSSITLGRSKSNKKGSSGSKKLIILQQTPRSASQGKAKQKENNNNNDTSFKNSKEDLNTSKLSRKYDNNRIFSSKKEDVNKSFSSKKEQNQDITHLSKQNRESPPNQIKNKKIFSTFESNGKISQNATVNKDKGLKANKKYSLLSNTPSSISSFFKESQLLLKVQSSNNKQRRQENNKQNFKFTLSSSSFKNGSNLTIDNIYGKTYNSSNSTVGHTTHCNETLTEKSFSQSTTHQNVGHFDFSQAVSQQKNRSLSNKNNRSVMNSFFSSRINTEFTPKSVKGLERRNSRSLSPSKSKIHQFDSADNTTTSSRKLIKASDIQKEYDNSRTSSSSRRKTANQSSKILKQHDFQQEYEQILKENFEILKKSYTKNQIIGQVNEKIIQEEFSKSLKILNQNFHLLSSEELIGYYDFIQNKAQILYKQFMKKYLFY